MGKISLRGWSILALVFLGGSCASIAGAEILDGNAIVSEVSGKEGVTAHLRFLMFCNARRGQDGKRAVLDMSTEGIRVDSERCHQLLGPER